MRRGFLFLWPETRLERSPDLSTEQIGPREPKRAASPRWNFDVMCSLITRRFTRPTTAGMLNGTREREGEA